MIKRFTKKEKIVYFKLSHVCILVEIICRDTLNTKEAVADYLGTDTLRSLYDAAEPVYDINYVQLKQLEAELITKYNIKMGTFTNVYDTQGYVPEPSMQGKTYARLAMNAAEAKHMDLIDALFDVYHSFICGLLDNYDCGVCYEWPDAHLAYYLAGYVCDE